MATTSEARALPFFTDLAGLPLQAGFIYIGQAGLDPVAYPAVITSDIAGTVVVAQPVRTTNGHAAAAGALIHLFVPIPYSITILDSARRLVYASLQETDPVAIAVSSSSVQSVPDLTSLRARSGSTTNQVWVTDVGMYVYQPNDTTSPDSFPTLVVGNDGSRYRLSQQYAMGPWLTALSPGAPARQGLYLSWNDAGDGGAYITTNEGAGSGGTIIRTVNSTGTSEIGRVAITATGGINSGAGITTLTGDVRSAGNVVANGGTVGLISDGSRNLHWDGVNNQYVMPSSPLLLNGSLAVTVADLVNINLNHLVGAMLLNQVVSPPTPGTWSLLAGSLGTSGINQWLRTA